MAGLSNIKSISNRFKNIFLATAFLATQLVVPASSLFTNNAAALSNNGTLKVHEKGTTSGNEPAPGANSNDPKVCIFNFEVFGVDPSQTGDITIETQGGGPAVVVGTISMTSDGTGYGETAYVNDVGSVLNLSDGHYKATLDNKFGTDAGDKAKSKVFKVQCEQPVVAPCVEYVAAGEVRPSNLLGFDFSETRSTGHYEFVEDGLHMWTEGTTSTDKVAAYKAVNVPLTDVGDPSLDYNSNFGIDPGYQLVLDFDNNGTPDGILVGETVYGSNWWLTNSAAQFAKDGAPHTGGGSGSNWFGTLNEWLAAFPDAHVLAFGFSLGSGVHADGVLRSITFNCGIYTFANDKGRIRIVKDAQPNSLQDFSFTVTGTGVSNFTLDDDFQVPGKDNAYIRQKQFDNLAAGTYTITENVTPGWYLDSVTCNARSTSSVDGRTVTITLHQDERVRCTFINKRLTKILVHKVTDPQGDQTSFPVTINADSGEVVGDTTGSISESSDATFWVKPGTYDVDEGNVAGWKQTRSTCQNLMITDGQSVRECTIYNEKLTGLTIIKDAQPDGAKNFQFTVFRQPFFGLPQYFDSFTLDDDGNANNAHSNQRNYTDIKSGWYVVNEQKEKGWSLKDISCSGDTEHYQLLNTLLVKVAKHQTPTCTFVNQRDTAKIRVIKRLLPANDEGRFDLSINGQTYASAVGDGGDTGYQTVFTGTHSVSETGANGTLINDYRTWHICRYDNFVEVANNNVQSLVTEGLLQKDNYNGVITGYGPTIDGLKLHKNDKLTCVFVNKRIPTITIIKDAQPDSQQSFTFATNFSKDFSLMDDGTMSGSESKIFKYKLHTNHEYTFKEQNTPGWALSNVTCTGGGENSWSVAEDNTLSVTPHYGDNLVCTFTNQQEANVTIVKDAQPDSSQSFTFTSDLNGEDTMFALIDNGSDADLTEEVFSSVAPGVYTVTETNLVGWTLSDITCGEEVEFSIAGNKLTLVVNPGDNITCTFVNAKKPVGQVLGSSTTDDGPELLPNTGQDPLVNILAGAILILLAVVSRWVGRKSQSATV